MINWLKWIDNRITWINICVLVWNGEKRKKRFEAKGGRRGSGDREKPEIGRKEKRGEDDEREKVEKGRKLMIEK